MSDAVWNIKQILEWTTRRFKELEFPTPLLDAQLLLCSVLKVNKVHLYTHADSLVGQAERAELKELVKRRMLGEPVAYLLEQKHWHDLDLRVDKRVLIPRPETETLLDFILGLAEQSHFSPEVIYDFCTGSGCLAIAAARRFPNAKVIGVDISEDALAVARENAERNGAHVEFENVDITDEAAMDALFAKYGRAQLIVANPPYVTEDEWLNLDIGVSKYEPKLALVADDQGCAVAVALLSYLQKKKAFQSDAVFAMELAHAQPYAVLERVDAKEQTSAVPFNCNVALLPRGSFFAMRDIELKERYLCWVGETSANFKNEEVVFETSNDEENFSQTQE